MTARVTTVAYGAPALSALEQVVADLKREDPMTDVTVLVPSDIAGLAVRRHLARGIGDRPGVAGIRVTTVERLADSLIAGRLDGRKPASTPVLAAAWRAELATNPGRFAPVADHAATVRALVRSHTELRDLNDEALGAMEASGALAADAVRLHRAVQGRLVRRYDGAHVLELAAELLDTGEFAAPIAVLHLPQVFSHREAAFVDALARAADLHVIVGSTGLSRFDEPVHRSLLAAGIAVEPATVQVAVASSVFNASDSDDEVRWVVRRVLRELAETPAHRIAVLYSSSSPYARLLHEHLAAAEINVNGPGVVAVRDRAVSRGFLAVLDLPRAEFARVAVFAAMGQAPIRSGDGLVPTARWERISREAGVVRGDDWSVRLDARMLELESQVERAVTDEKESKADYLRGSIERTRELQQFVASLRGRLDVALAATTWSELSIWGLALLRDYLGAPDELVGRLPAAELSALSALESTLRSLAELDGVESTADLATMVTVVDAELEASRPRVGRFGEGVFIGPISSAPGLDVDVVFVVGLSEDAYPGRTAPDALLPDDIRSLPEVHLPITRDRIAGKGRELAIAFGSGSSVIASFARGDLRRSTGRLPSRWLLPSIRHLSGTPDLVATEWEQAEGEQLLSTSSHWSELRRTPDAATDLEWRLRAVASDVPLVDARVDAALALIAARESAEFTRFDGDLRGATGLPDYARTTDAIAPTTLEGYAICPHAFLVSKLLKVEPIELPEEVIMISPLNSGNLVHEAFDTFFRGLDQVPGYGEAWTVDHKVRLRSIATEIGDRFAAAGLTGHPRLWERDFKAILLDLDAMLDDDSAERSARDARVVRTELSFGRGDVDPVRVQVPGGIVHMAGSIDKIDEQRDGRIVVQDIKTGKADSFRKIVDDVVVAGTKLQLPAYALAARQSLGATDAEAVYWFVRRNAGTRIPVVLDAATETRYSSTIGTLVESIATGLFPAKPPESADFMFVQCGYCNTDGIGHGEARVRYEHKRTDPALATLTALIDPEELS